MVTSSVSYLFSFMPALFCFRILISSGRVVRSKNKTNLLNINYGDAIFTYGNVNFVWFRCFVMILSEFGSIEMKNLKVWCEICYSQKSEQKWKKLVMQKNTLSMTAIEEYCTQHFLLWFLLLDSKATERGKKYVVNVTPCMMWCCF